ncbi:MAG: carbohydrate-binding protein, partial [bacterium]
EIDGVDKTGAMTVPNTGPWDTAWATVTKTGVSLTAGSHVMRVFSDTDLFDLNYIRWTADTTPPSTPTNLTATAVSSSQINLSWTASTDNVGIAGYRVFFGSTQIATTTGTGTTYLQMGLNPNTTYSYTVRAYDAAGNVSAQSASASATTKTATPTQSPYGGTARTIPGTIQAEHFDFGGEGVAYHDSDSANNGGLYRPNESVDIKAASDTGGGYAIGWILQPNEWFEYTVNVASAGTFTFAARVATIYSGKRFHVEIDGVNVTGSLVVPVTGTAWNTKWGTVTKSGINLTAGPHIMRVVADTDLFDLNYFTWIP